MKVIKPAYFDSFRCIASACPDSCCKEWDVDVDEQATALYTALDTELGDRLRQVLNINEDGTSCMEIINGRCPMWQEDGLCRIQAELGHEALCKTCRDFPRLTHDYGDFVELGLELSCPEAARIILSSPALPPAMQEIPGGETAGYDKNAMKILQKSRAAILAFLENPGCSVPEALAVLLIYGYQAQDELDGAEVEYLEPNRLLSTARSFSVQGAVADLHPFFLNLDILTPAWKRRLEADCRFAYWEDRHLRLARYFVERYWLQAVSDYDLISRVKFAVISCIFVCQLGGNLAETAQLYSKEIENSAENMDAILDATYAYPSFTDVNLLKVLLG